MKYDRRIHKYFRLGDVVINETIWGVKPFIIHGFGGNRYCPELYVHNKGDAVKGSCIWDVRLTKLVDSNRRPFKNLKKDELSKLFKNSKESVKKEIEREIIIRINKRIYGLI